VVFFSRRIGLNEGGEVPIVGGGRLTGRAGKFSVGVLNIQTEDAPEVVADATNFTVLRLRRDVLRRSNIGLLYTRRAPRGGLENAVWGADANLWFFSETSLSVYFAQSDTERSTASAKDRSSYRGAFEYAGDRYGVKYEHLHVGDDFDPQIGFLRRQDFTRNYGQLRFSPRLADSRLVRKHNVEFDFDYITGNSGTLETREAKLVYRLELNNNDQWALDLSRNYEFLRTGFDVVPDLAIGPGGYSFGDFRTVYQFGPQRPVSGSVTFGTGTFYDGRLTEVGYRGYVTVSPRLSIEPGVAVNHIDLPVGEEWTKLVSARANYMFSSRAFLSSFVQLNTTSFTLSSSVRFRWEYRPGSDLFVVYSDGRNTHVRGFPRLENRTFAIKLTRLFRF
jgi:hypothetical protein